jgi:hypothetical protein
MERLDHLSPRRELGDAMRDRASRLGPQHADAMFDRVRRIDERFTGERPGGCTGRGKDVGDALPPHTQQYGVGVHGDLG